MGASFPFGPINKIFSGNFLSICTPQAPSLCRVAVEVQAYIISYLHNDSLALYSLGIGNKSLGQMVFPKLYASVPTMALQTLSKSETDTQKILGIQHPSYYVDQLRVSTSGPRLDVVRQHFTPSLFNIDTHRDSMKLFSYTSDTLALSNVLGFWTPNSLSIKRVVLKCPTRNTDKLQLVCIPCCVLFLVLIQRLFTAVAFFS